MNKEDMRRRIEQLEKENEGQKVIIDELQARVDNLEEILRNANRKKYKTTSEMASVLQLSLFNEAETIADEGGNDPTDGVETIEVAAHTRKKKHGIGNSVMEEEIIHHELPEEERRGMVEVEPVTVKKLVYHPAKWVVEKHIIHRYVDKVDGACDIDGNLLKVPACTVPELLEGSMVTPSVFAYIVNEKFIKAVPLYRMEQVLARDGLELSRQTMSHWFLSITEIYLSPLIGYMRTDLLAMDILHGDETSVKCIEVKERQKCYMWLQCTPACSGKQIYLYTYHAGRDGNFCAALYEGFSGYLHCDEYSTYQDMDGVTVAGCWDHARRKAVDGIAGDPKKLKYDALKSKEEKEAFLNGSGNRGYRLKMELFFLIGELYALERKYKGLPYDEIKACRVRESVPVLRKIRIWLDTNMMLFERSGKFSEAVRYIDNNWRNLCMYVCDGRLEINNARAERGIKDFVIGRKNWLFNNTEKGAEASAAIYSLLVTAKMNDIKPYDYVIYILEEMLAMGHPTEEKMRDLLPYSDKLPDRLRVKKRNSK